jgi:3',5'-cyclic AMP phosphodiesterase CpdA
MPFVLAHVSDLHASTFGDTFHDRARLVKRSVRVADTSPERFEVCWEEAGWRVLREKATRRKKVTLVDPQGYAHPIPSSGEAGGRLDPIERAAAKACRLEARRASTLALALPGDGALAVLLEATPKNSNLRLLRAARAVEADGADAVVITGDLTDDGEGYELIEAAFDRFKRKQRLLVIPGNHDLYLFPLAGSARPRPTHEGKRRAWRDLAARLGLELDACGAWMKHVREADAVIVGLDSCVRKQRAFFRQNGAIGPDQLEWLRGIGTSNPWKSARHRIVLFHHHVVPLPHGVGRRAPTEIGMRLDDARSFAELLNAIGTTLVMHGHRHISERRNPAGCRFELVAAPSLTLGCKSGDAPSFWRIELDHRMHASRVPIPVQAIEQENDPGTDPPPPPGSAEALEEA